MKINTVVAKALANKTYNKLYDLGKQASKIDEEIALKNLDNDKDSIKFNILMKEALSLFTRISEKHKCLRESYFRGQSIHDYTYFSGFMKSSLPSVDEIKDNIILEQASSDDFTFDPEKFIEKLVSEYSTKLGFLDPQ